MFVKWKLNEWMNGLRLFIRNHHSIFVIILCPAIRTIRILFTSRKYFWRSIAAHLELLFPKLIVITNIYQLQDETHRIKEQKMTDNNFLMRLCWKYWGVEYEILFFFFHLTFTGFANHVSSGCLLWVSTNCMTLY